MPRNSKNNYQYIRWYDATVVINCGCSQECQDVRLTKEQSKHTCPYCQTEYAATVVLDVLPKPKGEYRGVLPGAYGLGE